VWQAVSPRLSPTWGTHLLAQAAPLDVPVEWWHWLAFGVFVVLLLVLDMAFFHRGADEPSLRKSAAWTAIWCAIALGFNGLLWAWRGQPFAVWFLTGYLLEWSLSMDNLFVFAVIFGYFRVPLKHQYRVLYWGIIGAIVMRLTFVLVGTALISKYHWVSWILGLFLVFTGLKLALNKENEVDPEHNWLMRLARRLFPVARENHGQRFFVKEYGRRCITPMFLVLLVIESTDVVFAVDSVPAIFGVTTGSFTVFTSNIFAILGLRALYFLLAGIMDLFEYLNYGLAAVLTFVGLKMIVEFWFPGVVQAVPHPEIVSLAVILSLLSVSILASIVSGRRGVAREAALAPEQEPSDLSK